MMPRSLPSSLTLMFLVVLAPGCEDPAASGKDSGAADTDMDPDADGGPSDDADGDGVGASSGDCDDSDSKVFPGARERCNGLDDDCDGALHEAEVDADGDGEFDCAACDAAGFWPDAHDVGDEDALDALVEDRFSARACDDYQAARTFLFLVLDNTAGSVEGVYTGATFDIGQATPDWDIVNTEHVWPRSDGAEAEPQECDLHHLFPADSTANTRRGNVPFGIVAGGEIWSEGGSTLGEDASGDPVFEPRDAVKGDIARAVLYFATRYGDSIPIDTQLDAQRLATFQTWHAADPPTRRDQQRSLRIAEEQGTANPFVVCPGLVDTL